MPETELENSFEDFFKYRTLDDMLDMVLNRALVSIKARDGSFVSGSLMVLDKNEESFQIKARLGPPRPNRKGVQSYKIADKGIAAWVVRYKQSYFCSDIRTDPVFSASISETPKGSYNFLSVLSVPIIYENKVVAVINADASEEGRFDETDMRNMEMIANTAARPIAERISIPDALVEIGVELTKMPHGGGVDPVLEKIANVAVKTLGVDVVTLYQYNQKTEKFLVEQKGPTVAGEIWNQNVMRTEVFPDDVPAVMVRNRQSGFYPDVREKDFLTGEVTRPDVAPRARFIDREGIESMATLLLPYRAIEDENEEVVGVMFANYRTPHEFNYEETEVLKAFSNYAAIAIQNVRREEKRISEQLIMVNSFSSSLAHRMSNLAGTGRVYAKFLMEKIRKDGIEKDDPAALRWLGQIEQESDVLLQLTKRISGRLKKKGKDTTKLHQVDLAVLVQKVKKRIKKVIKRINQANAMPENSELKNTELKNTKLEIGPIPQKSKVMSIDFQLEEVLFDLLKNALEAIEEQSFLQDHQYKGRLKISVAHQRTDNQMVFTIRDNGTGIPEEIQQNLFSPGYSTKKGNLGIGLWWSRIFLLATGGDVELVHTQTGKGSIFRVKIPCAANSDEAGVSV